MTRSAIYTTMLEGLVKEVSPSFYHVVGTPLAIQLLSIGGWQVVYCDHGKMVPCFNEPRASFELAVVDAFRALEGTRPMTTLLILPHPAPEAIRDAVVIRPSAQDGARSLVKPMERPATFLPTPMDEERMIDCVATQMVAMRQRFEKAFSLEWLATALREGLREGRLTLAYHAVDAADEGDELADAALRTVYAEMAGGALSERGPGHLQVWAYGQRAVLRAPSKRPRGRRWHDNWMRDVWTCDVIFSVWRTWGVQLTRNRYARGRPSAVSIVAAALGRSKIARLDEARVQSIWLGLPGAIVRSARGYPSRFSTGLREPFL